MCCRQDSEKSAPFGAAPDARSLLIVARQFEEAIPDTTLVVIEGAGHMSNLERPERVNYAVREFCRSHPPPRSG